MTPLEKIQAAKAAAESGNTTEPKTEVKAKAEPENFQEYKSAKSAMRLVTADGFRITFTNFRYLTQNSNVIAYLDAEIANGMHSITKGDVVTTEDLDPNAAIKRQAVADYIAEQKKLKADAADGKFPDMGSTELQKLNPTNTSSTVS